MTGKKIAFSIAAAAGLGLLGSATHAAITYQPVAATSALETKTFSPTTITVATIPSPYGAPVITQSGGNWILSFPLTAFTATATNAPGGGGLSVESANKLDFIVTFDGPVNLGMTMTESGSDSVTPGSPGLVNVFAGAVITENDHIVPQESVSGVISPVIGPATWSASGLINGFSGQYASYEISVDNDLMAEELFSAGGGTATITKSVFTITLTPGVPEPASLGLLGMGAAGMLMRRRRR